MAEPLGEALEQCCYTEGLIFIIEGVADVGVAGGEGSLFSTNGAWYSEWQEVLLV